MDRLVVKTAGQRLKSIPELYLAVERPNYPVDDGDQGHARRRYDKVDRRITGAFTAHPALQFLRAPRQSRSDRVRSVSRPRIADSPQVETPALSPESVRSMAFAQAAMRARSVRESGAWHPPFYREHQQGPDWPSDFPPQIEEQHFESRPGKKLCFH